MREIKFQVFAKDWEGAEKCFDGYFLHILDDGRYRVAFTNSDSDKEFVTVGRENIRFFTGLHDKNGKEIYEGDIISFDMFGIGEKEKAKIIFKEGTYVAQTNYSPTLDGTHHGHSLAYELGKMIRNNKDVEVISNIYENSELLEQTS